MYKNLTLVTAFFDLSFIEKRPLDRTNKNYLKWANFVLSMNLNLVIYIEKKNFEYILNKRKEYNLLNKTKIVIREFRELCFHNLKTNIKNLLIKSPIKNSSIKDTENYLITTWNKIYLLEETINDNPFNSDYYGWIDIGIYHVVKNNIPNKNLENIFDIINDKITILELRWITNKELLNVKEFCSEFRWKIAAGLWTGNKHYLLLFIRYFKEILFNLLSREIAVHEETIFSFIYKKYNEIFYPYYGNYQQILTNYNKLTEYDTLILNNIRTTRFNKDFGHALDICIKVKNELYEILSPSDRFNINDEISINSFYIDKNKSANFIIEWFKILEKDEDQKKIGYNKIDRILSNLKFYDEKYDLINKFKKIYSL